MNYNVIVLYILVYCINFFEWVWFLMKLDGNKNYFCYFCCDKVYKN